MDFDPYSLVFHRPDRYLERDGTEPVLPAQIIQAVNVFSISNVPAVAQMGKVERLACRFLQAPHCCLRHILDSLSDSRRINRRHNSSIGRSASPASVLRRRIITSRRDGATPPPACERTRSARSNNSRSFRRIICFRYNLATFLTNLIYFNAGILWIRWGVPLDCRGIAVPPFAGISG
jgi:hypothetical protein